MMEEVGFMVFKTLEIEYIFIHLRDKPQFCFELMNSYSFESALYVADRMTFDCVLVLVLYCNRMSLTFVDIAFLSSIYLLHTRYMLLSSINCAKYSMEPFRI